MVSDPAIAQRFEVAEGSEIIGGRGVVPQRLGAIARRFHFPQGLSQFRQRIGQGMGCLNLSGFPHEIGGGEGQFFSGGGMRIECEGDGIGPRRSTRVNRRKHLSERLQFGGNEGVVGEVVAGDRAAFREAFFAQLKKFSGGEAVGRISVPERHVDDDQIVLLFRFSGFEVSAAVLEGKPDAIAEFDAEKKFGDFRQRGFDIGTFDRDVGKVVAEYGGKSTRAETGDIDAPGPFFPNQTEQEGSGRRGDQFEGILQVEDRLDVLSFEASIRVAQTDKRLEFIHDDKMKAGGTAVENALPDFAQPFEFAFQIVHFIAVSYQLSAISLGQILADRCVSRMLSDLTK